MRSRWYPARKRRVVSLVSKLTVMLAAAMVLLVLPGALAAAQGPPGPNSRAIPTQPFHVIGNIYFVGPVSESGTDRSDATSFLITTPEGHILIDSVFEDSVPRIRDNVEALGFRVEDIKILLNSHAHTDHMAGHKLMKELTGAEVYMSEEGAAVMADGGRSDFRSDGRQLWDPLEADHILEDGDSVTLGGVTLTAHLTPGHTKGCTTWTMVTEDGGLGYNVVIAGGVRPNPNETLVGNPAYPQISEDFRKAFRTLKSLSADVFLAVHGSWFRLPEKAIARAKGLSANPFIDPQGYRDYVRTFEQQYLDKLEADRASATGR